MHAHVSDSPIIVTGASGMVGQALVNRWRRAGLQILTPRSQDLDLRNQHAVHEFVAAHRPKLVVHLAGLIGGIKANSSRPVDFFYENAMMGLNIIHASHVAGVRKLVFLGSSCIYPRDCPQPMREDYLLTGKLEPTNQGYALAKICGVKLCEYYNRQHDRDYLSLLPCNVYGANDNFNPETSHVVSGLLRKFHEAKAFGHPMVEIWGTGTSRREFMFVDDLASAIDYFAFNKSAADLNNYVNIGTGEDISIRDLAGLIKDITAYEGSVVFNASQPDGMPRKLLDISRATAHGWTASVGLWEGLQLTYEWYKSQLRA